MSENPWRSTKLFFTAAALTMTFAPDAMATVFSWRASGTNWSAPTSWSPLGVPNSGDAVEIPGDVSRIVNQDIVAGVTVASMSFGASNVSAYVQVTGSQISLLNGG